MIDHELTDPTGSALTITHNIDGVWITATDTHDEVTVGPFPAHVLHEALDEASPPDTPVDIAARVRRLLSGAGGMFGDYMDGGVTAAAIENEVVSPERARSLVQENDELRARIGRVEEARDLYRQDVWTAERREQEASDRAERAEKERDRWREYRDGQATENPRPLTADDIPVREFEAMADRALTRWDEAKTVWAPRDAMREAMRAALTPPPSRPEGAEEIEALVDEWKLLPESPGCPRPTLPDFLAERGVRVTRAES